MITFADHTMHGDIAELRRICFDESEQYIEFYLANRFTPHNTLVYVEQGRAVASLTLLPATVTTPGRTFPAAYVYAVATLPAFRRRGIAGALLDYAATKVPALEALLLIPASEELADYYAKFGYRYSVYRKEITADITDACNHPASRIDVGPLYAADFLRLRAAAFNPSGYFIGWDAAALDYALMDCEMSHGFARLLRAGDDEGFFLAYPKYGWIVVEESSLTPQLLPWALYLIRKYFGDDRRVVFYQAQHTPASALPAGKVETGPLAMLKCLTPDAQPAPSAMPYFGLPLD
jgi:GNAT superfamily N-acetyltransferase